MSKRWLSLLGIIFAVYLNPPRTSAQHVNIDDGDDPSLQGLGSDTRQPMSNNSSGNVISQSANYLNNYTRGGYWGLSSVLGMMSVPDVGSMSNGSVSRGGRDQSNTTDLSYVVQASMSLVQRIATDPLSIVSIVIDWVNEMMTNLTVAVIARSWKITVDYIIPRLDDMAVKMVSFEAVPDTVKSYLGYELSANNISLMGVSLVDSRGRNTCVAILLHKEQQSRFLAMKKQKGDCQQSHTYMNDPNRLKNPPRFTLTLNLRIIILYAVAVYT